METFIRAARENSRKAHLTHCKCGARVWRGLDDDRCALRVTCDMLPVGHLGEAVALLQGRATFNLWADSARCEIQRRSRWHISAPKGTPVIVEHKCGQPVLFGEEWHNTRRPPRTYDAAPF